MKIENKKIFFLILIIIGFIILLIYFLFFHRKMRVENRKDLTVAEKVVLNGNEEEILLELTNVNYNLLNPKNDNNTNNYTNVAKPSKSKSLKNYCKKIYEVRKTKDDDGKEMYMFDMETSTDDENISTRRIIVTQNGEIKLCNFAENDYKIIDKKVEKKKNNKDLGIEFTKAILQGLNKHVDDMWKKAIVFENVNYDKILSKI